MRSRFYSFFLCLLFGLLAIPGWSQSEHKAPIPGSVQYVPTQLITSGPGHHWFGYYDKLQFDPTGRYALAARVDFEGRSPEPEDDIRIGMIDLNNHNQWTELGSSTAWGWQQGCMLQFIPGSESKVIWNDRQEGRYVSHIKDVATGETRTLPFPIYTLSPDGKTALSVDFERINEMRPGYGYAGIPDPNRDKLAPEDAGIYRCDLETGEKSLIISLDQMNKMPLKESDDPTFKDFYTHKNWFNHLLFNTDGTRFVFLHRWRSPSKGGVGGFGTLMYSSDLEGKDIRIVDGSGYTSHFIWRDPEHLAMWTRHKGTPGFFLFKDDGSDRGTHIGEGVMTRNGHNTYLPGNEWILNDTYPDGERMQRVYLYYVPTGKRIPIGDFFLDPSYKGEWRCDTHPRFSPDGKKVVIDCPVGDGGRQLVLMDISGIVDSTHFQQDPVIEKIIEIGRTDNRTMQHLDILCNRFGGRLIGSDAYENASIWAATQFHKWGMEVIMDEAGEIPVGFNRGPWFGKLLSEEGMILHFATPSYTSGTKGVQRGHVLIEPRTEAEFNRMKRALKGAWVLISGDSNGFPIDISSRADSLRDSIKVANREIAGKNSEIRRENRIRRENGQLEKELIPVIEEPALFYKEMKEAGILGIIQSAKTPIQVMADRKNVWHWTFETLPTVPDIKLDEHQYKKIYQMAQERRYFLLEFDIRNHFKMGPVKYHNVIGIIPGTEFPEEYVIMSGHLDAYDVATGGVDDGSGVTTTMEAARLIMEAGGKPKRSILAILWAGEEFGLLGSQSWVTRYKEEMDKISNMVNRDGGPTVPASISVTKAMWEDFEGISQVINRINPDFPFELKERTPREKPTVARYTDTGPFTVEGVPTIGFNESDPKGYNFNYREIWHTERDLYNKSIPEYQEHTSIASAVLVYHLANLDHLLSREGYYIEKPLEPVKKEKRKKSSKKNRDR